MMISFPARKVLLISYCGAGKNMPVNVYEYMCCRQLAIFSGCIEAYIKRYEMILELPSNWTLICNTHFSYIVHQVYGVDRAMGFEPLLCIRYTGILIRSRITLSLSSPCTSVCEVATFSSCIYTCIYDVRFTNVV